MKIKTLLNLSLVSMFLCGCASDEEAGPAPLPEGFVDPDTSEELAERYHPLVFSDPGIHGPEAMNQRDDCQSCHGEDLNGGTSQISCDTCHPQGWRTDCVYCHGGVDNMTGAPPGDVFNNESPSFLAHSAHITGTIHSSFGCEQCHLNPTDIFSPGHLFNGDDTPGVAEVDFTLGQSPAGRYLGVGSCADLYCHGNGLGDNGTVSHGERDLPCTSCHPNADSDVQQWQAMSGRHAVHLFHGATCSMCHGDTVNPLGEITNTSEHVNGAVGIQMIEDMEMNRLQGSCTGGCHLGPEFEQHNGRPW